MTQTTPSTFPDRPPVRRLAPLLIPAAVVVVLLGALLFAFRGGRQATPEGAPPLSTSEVTAVADAARQALRQAQPGRAEAMLLPAVERAPRDVDLRTLLAEALLAQGKPKEAHTQYEHAIFIADDNAELRFAAGAVASMAGMTVRAEEHFWRAQQLAPTNPKHPLYLGQVQRKLEKKDEARASFFRAATLDPNLALAWGSLAVLALDENNLSVAMNYVRKAREADPSSLTWRIVEAKILRRDNKPEEALLMLSALDERARLTDPALLEEMALCHGMLREPAKASTLYADAADAAVRENGPNAAEFLLAAAAWSERAGDRDVAEVYASRAAKMGNTSAQAFVDRLRGEQ